MDAFHFCIRLLEKKPGKVKVSPSRGASFLRRRVLPVTQRRLSVAGSPGEGCCQGRSRKTGAAGARSTFACVFVPIIPLCPLSLHQYLSCVIHVGRELWIFRKLQRVDPNRLGSKRPNFSRRSEHGFVTKDLINLLFALLNARAAARASGDQGYSSRNQQLTDKNAN